MKNNQEFDFSFFFFMNKQKEYRMNQKMNDLSHVTINKGFINIHDSAHVKIGARNIWENLHLIVKEGATLEIGDDCFLFGRIVVEKNSILKIGHRLQTTNDKLLIRSAESSSIIIGNDCLFADPSIYNSDYHGIYDIETEQRINPPENVIIEDRVWLALRSMVLKGAHIQTDTVVGATSVVLKGSYPSQCILAGNPAKVVKTGVVWQANPSPKRIK